MCNIVQYLRYVTPFTWKIVQYLRNITPAAHGQSILNVWPLYTEIGETRSNMGAQEYWIGQKKSQLGNC